MLNGCAKVSITLNPQAFNEMDTLLDLFAERMFGAPTDRDDES
jgi:hypothetical protein